MEVWAQSGRSAGMVPTAQIAQRVQTYRRMRARLARAVIDGDIELAQLASRRCSELVDEWFEQDFKGRTFDGRTMD